MAKALQTPVDQTLLCVVAMAVLLQLAIPFLTTNVSQIRDLLGMLPGVVEVADAHSEHQIGGALVMVLIVALACVIAPYICPSFGL